MKDLKAQLQAWNQAHPLPTQQEEEARLAKEKAERAAAAARESEAKAARDDEDDDADLFLAAVSDIERGAQLVAEKFSTEPPERAREPLPPEAGQARREQTLFLDAMASLDKSEKG